jgi:Transposase DDE domain group 1
MSSRCGRRALNARKAPSIAHTQNLALDLRHRSLGHRQVRLQEASESAVAIGARQSSGDAEGIVLIGGAALAREAATPQRWIDLRNDRTACENVPSSEWPKMYAVAEVPAALGCAASPSQMGRFETRWLTAEKNLLALADLSGQWIDMVHARRPPRGIVLDMDSSVSPTHGEQEMSVWNGHYACTCYHPLFVFNQFGDLERCADQVRNTRLRNAE